MSLSVDYIRFLQEKVEKLEKENYTLKNGETSLDMNSNPELVRQSFTEYQINKNKEFDQETKNELYKEQERNMQQTNMNQFNFNVPMEPSKLKDDNIMINDFNPNVQTVNNDQPMSDIEEVGKWPVHLMRNNTGEVIYPYLSPMMGYPMPNHPFMNMLNQQSNQNSFFEL